MPYNHRVLENRLEHCKKKLNVLLENQENHLFIQRKIRAVDTYYTLSYAKATSAQTIEHIATSYETFVDNLEQVKKGTLKPELAINQISRFTRDRKKAVEWHDLVKVCESMFWAATAFSLYAAVWSIALPVLIVQPVLGVAVAITIAGAMLKAAYSSLSCLAGIKSFSRHHAEYDNEVGLVSFFEPTRRIYREEPVQEETLDHCFISIRIG